MKTAANFQRFEDFQISDVKKIIDEFLRKSNLKKAQNDFPKMCMTPEVFYHVNRHSGTQ